MPWTSIDIPMKHGEKVGAFDLLSVSHRLFITLLPVKVSPQMLINGIIGERSQVICNQCTLLSSVPNVPGVLVKRQCRIRNGDLS
jgi:hypothetical protein